MTVATVARRLVLVAAVPVGAGAGIVTLLATVAVTGQRALATVAGTLALGLATGVPAWWAARGARRRTALAIAVTGLTFALVAVVVGTLVHAPAPPYTTYPVPPGVQYWDLATGSRIAYTKTAAPATARATPVILVHGGPGAPDAPAPEPAASLATAGFDVYAYHQLGAGLSGRLADASGYTVARHVEDLEAIRRTLGVERVVLIGASWGGQLIANYLATHPTRVEKAVVSSPGVIWAPAFTDTERLTEAGLRDQQQVTRGQPRFMLAHALMHTIGPQAARALLPDATMDGVYQSVVAGLDMAPGCTTPNSSTSDPAGHSPVGLGFWANAATVHDSRRVPDPRPRLRNLTAPVLVLRGQCDYIAWPVTREYRDLLPGAVLLPIDGAGHRISTDQPERYRQAILAFLVDEPLPIQPHTAAEPPW
ncbi:alpha/beta fold hydrolase [Dactylosporangium sp. CA-233914]|uniref:alpha/beta fold hydrolase n=1 Tax=Dactylosporangium sp. CA-233914 TaxID=3239934 RepID=UPI003D8D5F35